MERDPVLALMKFGAAEDMAELVRHGRVYMQSIPYFKALESDVARGDRHEGLLRCWQADRMRLDIKQGDEWLNVGGIVEQVVFRDQRAEAGNIYCMFALRGSHAEAFHRGHARSLVDVEKLAFGDTAVVFGDAEEFLRRVRTAAQDEGLGLQRQLVRYVDRRTYHGLMGPFRKFSEFAHQSEYRLLVKPEAEGARSLVLGPLEDIAMLCPRGELNQRLRIRKGGDPA